MGQTIKEVDHIVNEQCKQESREYQWIIDKEEESKNAIIEHVCIEPMTHLCENSLTFVPVFRVCGEHRFCS